jgi:pimeloyl-ACP methyl ester carboxylesterase
VSDAAALEAGDGELVLVIADGVPGSRLAGELLPLLGSRFHAVLPPTADASRGVLDALAPGRWAAVGFGEGAGSALELALDRPGAEALVLVGPVVEHGSRREELAAWEVPVLIFGGEDDPIVPVTAFEALNEAMPSSTLGLLPGCGHDLVAEALDTIGPMIHEYLRVRFLGAPHEHGHDGLVTLQLERRPAWVDLAPYEAEDDEPVEPDPGGQEVGPGA